MAFYLVERQFTEDLEITAEEADRINRINSEEDVTWLYSFVSADLRKTFCLYEAPSDKHIFRAAERAGIPADSVVPLGGRMLPQGALVPV